MITQIIILLLTFSTLAINVTGTTKKVNGAILQNLDDMMVNAAKMTRNFFIRSEMNWWNRMWDRTDYQKNVVYYHDKVNAEARKLQNSLYGAVKNPKEVASSLNRLVRAGNVIAHSLSRRSTVPQHEMKVIGKYFVEASKVLAKTFTRKWMEDIHQCYLSQYFYQATKDYLYQVRYNRYLNSLAGQRPESRVCAKENELCTCHGSVKYGAGQKWSRSKNVKGTIHCDNKTFGDVNRGAKKFCVCKTPLLTHRSNFRRFMALAQAEMVQEPINIPIQPNMPEMNDFLEANEFEDVEESFESNEFESLMNTFEDATEANDFEVDETEGFNTNEAEADAKVFDAEMEADADEMEVGSLNFFSMAQADEAEGFNVDSMANEFEDAEVIDAEGDQPEIFNFLNEENEFAETNEFDAEGDQPEIFNFLNEENETVADEVEGFNFEASEFEAGSEEAGFNFESMPEPTNEFQTAADEEVGFNGFNFESMPEPTNEFETAADEDFNFDTMDEATDFVNYFKTAATEDSDEAESFNFDAEGNEFGEEANQFDEEANETSNFFNFEDFEN